MKRKVEDVKKEVLGCLWLRPLTIQEISKKIDSNWLTVEKFVKELEQERKVKEVISTEKLTLYQRVEKDTYYEIPLKDEDKEMFKFIFSTVLAEYKKKKKIPNRTEFSKAVVDVIHEAGINKKLPVVWYLYGQIPLMIADPQKEYEVIKKPGNHEEIEKIAKKIVGSQNYKDTSELKFDHYEKYNKKLYDINLKLYKELKAKNSEKILNLFREFYVACPVGQDGEMFYLVDRLCSVVYKLDKLGILEDNILEIALALDSLWKYMALNQMIYSLSNYENYRKEDLMQFYFNPIIETKKYSAEESIQNIELIYLENLDKFDPESVELSKEVQEIREIMQDWTGED